MSELAIPSVRELQALSPADRWNIEDALDEAQDTLRDFNDDELRRWVEIEGKTQAEIAERVGRTQQAVAKRCRKLDIEPQSNRGRPRGITTGGNSGGEIVDAEVVEDEPLTRRRSTSNDDGPAHHLPDVVAPDAEDNLRTQTLHWFEQGNRVKGLLDKRRSLEPRSEEDRKAIGREAAVMERVARRLMEVANA